LIRHAVTHGIPETIARRGVLHNLSGSLQLMLEEATPPEEIVKRFLDYGGVTTEGLNAMIDSGFRQAVQRGLERAHAAARTAS